MTAVVIKTLLLGEAVGNSTAFKNGDLIVALLLLVLGIALGIGVTCLVMVVHFLRKGRLINRPIARRINLLTRERRVSPPIFNLPTRWMAVRSGIAYLEGAPSGRTEIFTFDGRISSTVTSLGWSMF